jgi:hypothetical protein
METQLIIDNKARTATNVAPYTPGSVAGTSRAAISGSLSSGSNTQTGIAQTLMSDTQGRYRAPELRIDYEVRVSNASSDTVVYKGKAPAVGVQSAADFSLAVGQQTQTVVVQAQVSQVETTKDAIENPTSRQQMPGTKERGYA